MRLCLCYTVVRIAAAVYEVLRPILNEIKEDISCMKSDIASLNETVSQLAGKLEDHKNETTSELASVNSELVDLQLSLQSMIDNPPIEAVSSAVLVSLVPYFNAMESGLKTELATGLNSLNSSMRDDLNNLKTELATGDDLNSMELDIKTEFATGLSMMNSSLRGDLNSMEHDIKTEFATGLRMMNGLLRVDLNAMELDIKTEFATSLSMMNSSLRGDLNSMEHDIKTEFATSLSMMNSSLRGDLNSMEHDIKTEFATGLRMMNGLLRVDLNAMELDIRTEFATGLNTMRGSMGEDFTDIKTELSGVSNTTQGLCDKIEEHDAEITAELKELSNYIIPQRGYRCGGTGGWRHAIYLDMTDPNTECPSGWSIITSDSKRTCGMVGSGSTSVFFPVSGGPYSQVCGRIRAYQSGIPQAFHGYNSHRYDTIDSIYFDGVAIMYGSPRQHVWTFAAGIWENRTSSTDDVCPCDTTVDIPIPPFVGEDYFCESGYVYPWNRNYGLHSNDTLWDGEDCHSSSSCCSLHNPPYFTKSLGQSTTDDLELRTCSVHGDSIAIELLEVYVKMDLLGLIGERTEEHMKEVKSQLMEINQNLLHHTLLYKCGGTGGWRRAVYLDMKNPYTHCPSGWNLTDYSKETCGRASTGVHTCDSVFFPVSGGPYSQVCGRITAYQWWFGYGFHGFFRGRTTIDRNYFDGVAVMHGSPRQHIWTFANGGWENDTTHRSFNCPCDTTSNIPIPPFVGEDYFCESGYVHPGYRSSALEYRLHSNDTLWDGEDCHSSSSCCSLHNPPYFTKSLGQSTTDDLELRMCHYNPIRYSNTAVELVELYVK